MTISCLLRRPFITNGNVLLVQFVSDLSVTFDGFLAYYTSVPRGSQITPVVSGAGTRSIPLKPVVKPPVPKRPAATKPPPAPTAKYVPPPPPEPTEKPRPVKPTRGRGQPSTGQDRRVPVTRPNGKRPGEWGHVNVCASMTRRCLHLIRFLCLLHVSSGSKPAVCPSL